MKDSPINALDIRVYVPLNYGPCYDNPFRKGPCILNLKPLSSKPYKP